MAREEYLSIKLSEQERNQYQSLADSQGVSLGGWIRGACEVKKAVDLLMMAHEKEEEKEREWKRRIEEQNHG